MGNLTFHFFASLLERVESLQTNKSWEGRIFCDIGAGAGRLVFSAAALYNWKECRGVEILDSIYDHSINILNSIEKNGSCLFNSSQKLSNIVLKKGIFTDPYFYLGDVNLFFIFSSCMQTDILDSLAVSLGRQAKPGSYIITTDYSLPLNGTVPPVEDSDGIYGSFLFEIVDVINGSCEVTGGESTAYIHLVKESMYDGKVRTRPTLSPSEEAYKLVTELESGTLTDTKKFITNVYNNAVREQ